MATPFAPTSSLSPEEVSRLLNVSRETLTALQEYVTLLRTWQNSINLVSSSTLPHVWQRHILDSAQIYTHIPAGARTLVDMGSGAGLPGLVLAILGRDRPDFHVTLIDSSSKKCAFLRQAAASLGLDVTIVRARVEAASQPPADVVTARALAPLERLLSLARHYRHDPGSGKTTCCFFLKGQDVGQELTATAKCWKLNARCLPSLSDPSGAICVIEDFEPC